jgi:hypothetical protein
VILKFPNSKEIDLQKIGIDFDLSSQQVECINLIHDFALLHGYQTFTLKGFAGSGKTTCVKVILKLLNVLGYFNARIAITAPTHKAKNVLEKLSGRTGNTIHSICSLLPNVDIEKLDMSNIQFDPKSEPSIPYKGILIIDEVSMCNDTLVDLVCDFCQQVECKVLFIGDPAQLKPVKQQKISKVFFLENNYELTQVQRQQDGNPLNELLFKIRNLEPYEEITQLNQKGEGIEYLKSNEFIDRLFEEFTSPNYSKDYVKAISYTNDNVKLLNQYIRQMKGFENVLDVGDLLMTYDGLLVNNNIKLANSMDFEVVKVKESILDHYGTKMEGFDIGMINEKGIVYETFLLHPETDQKKIIEIGDTLEELRQNAIFNKKLWFRYYGLKDAFCSFQSIRSTDDRVIKSKSIDYGFASSVHKIQGTTTEVIFVDNDFGKSRDKQLEEQLRYVAYSRPTKKVVVKR